MLIQLFEYIVRQAENAISLLLELFDDDKDWR